MEQESHTFLAENDILGIRDLIYISRFYGQDSRFVIAGGGNTSYKNKEIGRASCRERV